jgi:hypothetical protein
VAIALTLATIGIAVYAFGFAKPDHWVLSAQTGITVGTLTVSSYLMCLYFTTESLLFLSVHGRARVIAISGGLGATRAARQCAVDIVKHINQARKQTKQSRPAYLRDEMREHSRLHDQGALNDEQYEEAKGRILRAHG